MFPNTVVTFSTFFHVKITRHFSGGPFGVELSLRAAGNLYTIIGFAAMPLILSIPEAVMIFELSTLYPCPSGGVRFVSTTCNDTYSLLSYHTHVSAHFEGIFNFLCGRLLKRSVKFGVC